MRFVVDTNVLLRFASVNDPQHRLISDAVDALVFKNAERCYSQQNRREFWNVCTRPAERNGLGCSIEETKRRLASIDTVFVRLGEHSNSGLTWDRLVVQYEVMGIAAHDAQLVAFALAHGIERLITLNEADFRRYASEITPVHPSDALRLAGS